MTNIVNTEIEPGDTVEVWDDRGLQCRATVDRWDAACVRWLVTDLETGAAYGIPESYLTKIEE